jgi:hypothetical protein
MKGLKAVWRVGWRVALCAFPAGVDFSIHFRQRGKEFRAATQLGLDWNQLERGWSNGAGLDERPAGALADLAAGASAGAGRFAACAYWRQFCWGWPAGGWCWGCRDSPLSWGRATGITFVAQFFNSFLLGSTGGDVIKALYAARETHHKKTEAVVTVFVDRLLGLWAMLFFAALMMIPNAGLLPATGATGRARLVYSADAGRGQRRAGRGVLERAVQTLSARAAMAAEISQGRISGALAGFMPALWQEQGFFAKNTRPFAD